MYRLALVLAFAALACSKKLGPYEQAQEDQRKASCPDLKTAAECAARLDTQRVAAAQAADAGRLAAEQNATAASAAAAAAQEAELRGLSRDAREARAREVCRPRGHCNTRILHQISRSTNVPAERKAISAICLTVRNEAVAALRAELVTLRRLEGEARRGEAECSDIDDVKQRLSTFGGFVVPDALVDLRTAAVNVRLCACADNERGACDFARKTLKSAEKELSEPQGEYCE